MVVHDSWQAGLFKIEKWFPKHTKCTGFAVLNFCQEVEKSKVIPKHICKEETFKCELKFKVRNSKLLPSTIKPSIKQWTILIDQHQYTSETSSNPPICKEETFKERKRWNEIPNLEIWNFYLPQSNQASNNEQFWLINANKVQKHQQIHQFARKKPSKKGKDEWNSKFRNFWNLQF